MIKFRCSHCNKLLGIDNSEAGKMVTCPQCKRKSRIPTPGQAPSPRPPAAGAIRKDEGLIETADFEVVEEEIIENLEIVDEDEIEEIEEITELESVEDEKPRPRARRVPRRDPEEDDEEDAPRAKRRARDEDEEEDDEEEDDEPRARKKAKLSKGKKKRRRDEDDDEDEGEGGGFFNYNRVAGIVGMVLSLGLLVYGIIQWDSSKEGIHFVLPIVYLSLGGIMMLSGLYYLIKG